MKHFWHALKHRLAAIGALVGVYLVTVNFLQNLTQRFVIFGININDLFRYSAPTILTSALVLLFIGIAYSSKIIRYARIIVFIYLGWVTLILAGDVLGLVFTLGQRRLQGPGLLTDATIVWLNNVVLFAVWSWVLDAGGPERRHGYDGPFERADFVFPQQANKYRGWEKWRPEFWDYLFLAFNTSTAFSPADTLALSWSAKSLMMMIQAFLSLGIIAGLAARAINTLV